MVYNEGVQLDCVFFEHSSYSKEKITFTLVPIDGSNDPMTFALHIICVPGGANCGRQLPKELTVPLVPIPVVVRLNEFELGKYIGFCRLFMKVI